MNESTSLPLGCKDTIELNHFNPIQEDLEHFHLSISQLAQNIRRDKGKVSGSTIQNSNLHENGADNSITE